MANPTPGDADYYDFVTKKGKYAPKKTTSKTSTKTTTKKKDKISDAVKQAEERKKKYTGGLASMLGL